MKCKLIISLQIVSIYRALVIARDALREKNKRASMVVVDDMIGPAALRLALSEFNMGTAAAKTKPY
jgi:hypothetical protein